MSAVGGDLGLKSVVRPTWTPTEIRSAINMTAKDHDVVNADGSATDAFDLGSGRVDLTRASRSTALPS